MRTSARAIIINDRKQLLVFERERQQGVLQKLHHYYSIPGGGIEPNESPEQAVVRELYEEMLVRIVPIRLIARQIDDTDQRENFYFLARIVEGTPTFNPRSEEAQKRLLFQKSTYKVAWADVNDPLLAYHQAYAQIAYQLSNWLEKDNFPAEPVDMRVKNR